MQDEALHAVAEPGANIIAERAENKFLFAKISTSSLLRSASQVTVGTLDQFIAENATTALERDFVDLDNAFCKQFGRTDAGATAMLTALAWAQGDGVPIRDGIWASMANAISRIGGDTPERTSSWRERLAERFGQRHHLSA